MSIDTKYLNSMYQNQRKTYLKNNLEERTNILLFSDSFPRKYIEKQINVPNIALIAIIAIHFVNCFKTTLSDVL